MTADVRRAPRRGTSSAYAIKRRHPTQAREIDRLRSGDASFARSFDPRTSILTMLRARKSRRWGTGGSIAVGQTCVKQEEPAPGLPLVDGARLAACHRFRKGEGVARQRRKEVEASVPARFESPGLVARTS
jgi:hypothetical protein